MLVEQLDLLRCTNPHRDANLVATASRTVDRRIVEGVLGCPVCSAEYAIRGGTVWFGSREPEVPAFAGAADAEAVRLAALLSVDDRGGCYILCGEWGTLARALVDVAPAELLLVSPPPDVGDWSTLRGAGDAIPLAGGRARGVAIDRPSPSLAEAAARALTQNGRLIAPAATPVPASITILARDERHWVGVHRPPPAPPALVVPRRAAPRTGSY